MNFITLLERLDTLGIPVAHNEFIATKKNPAPDPPFAVWLRSDIARGADNINNLLEINGSFELYTEGTDEALEAKMEDEVLFDVSYERYQAPVSSENMTQTAYDFTILEKRRTTNE